MIKLMSINKIILFIKINSLKIFQVKKMLNLFKISIVQNYHYFTLIFKYLIYLDHTHILYIYQRSVAAVVALYGGGAVYVCAANS